MTVENRPILVATDPFDPSALPKLEGIDVRVLPDLRPETYRPLMRQAHVLMVRSGAPIPADILDDAPALLGVVRHGVGIDVIPMEAAARLAIPVANAPGCNAQSVAEYGVTVIGMLSRQLHVADNELRRQGWGPTKALLGSTRELAGKSVGIVGIGEVGRRLAHICHAGFGMKILGYQPRTDSFPEFVAAVSLDYLFMNSDFLVLACPLTAQTRRMVSKARLQSMRRSAFLVNLARGELVDTDSLVQALQDKTIAGAALDVFDSEPLPADHPLLQSDRVILTPHIASRTRESDVRMSSTCADQVLQLLRGEAPTHLVNEEVWEAGNAKRSAILKRMTGL